MGRKGEWNELEISRLIQPHWLKFGGCWGQCQGRLPRQLAFAALIGLIEVEQNEMIAYYVCSTLRSNLKRSTKNKEPCGNVCCGWWAVPGQVGSKRQAVQGEAGAPTCLSVYISRAVLYLTPSEMRDNFGSASSKD